MLDSADEVRTSTLRAEVLALGNSHAERIIKHFDALPREQRDRLQRAFDESAGVLRQRKLIRPVRPRDRTRITHSAVGPLTAVPGILLMAPRIERAWNPDPMVYTRRRRITWRIGAWDLSPKSRRTS